MQGVFLIVNFGDRAHASAPLLEAFETALRDRDEPHRIVRSASIPHCHQLMGEAWEEGYRTLLIGGGDGTLNVALNHPLAPKFTLGVLPLGTVNALARSLGLDARRPVDALRRNLAAPPAPSAVGRVEERRFMCFASAGYDAEVVHRARGLIKRVLRRGAFGALGLWEAARIRGLPRFAYRVDGGDPAQANLFVLSNINCYAGATLFNTTIKLESFQGFAMDARSMTGLARLAWQGIKGPPMEWVRRVEGARAFPAFRRLEVACTRPVAVQIDGEPFTPREPRRMTFLVEPELQSFLVPRRR